MDAVLIERVARAIQGAMETDFPAFTRMAWEDLTPLAREAYLRRGHAAVEAMQTYTDEQPALFRFDTSAGLDSGPLGAPKA